MSDERVSIRVLPDRVIECRAEGHLTRQGVLVALRDLDVILAREPGRFNFLSDGLAVEGFDSGIPIAVVRWAAARADRYLKSAIVASQHSLVSVSRTFAYILPTIPVGVFRTREEAFAFLSGAVATESLPGEAIAAVKRVRRPSFRAPPPR